MAPGGIDKDMKEGEELSYEQACIACQVELEKHLEPAAASHLLDRLEGLIQAKARELQEYITDIEIQDTRVKLSLDLKNHKHGQAGEVLQPYEVRE